MDHVEAFFEMFLIEPIRILIALPAMAPVRQLANAGSFEEAVKLVVAVITIFPAKEPTELVKERKVVSRAIPMSEVQEHNKAADCWVAMEGKVYDITKYVEEHPGGEAAISKYAGQDISVPFRGDQHGSQVDDVIANYYIGELVDAK